MSEEAATPTGGAEVSARPDASAEQKPLSITERLKASLFAPQEEAKPEMAAQPAVDADADPAEPKAPAVKADAKAEVVDDPDVDAGDEQTEASYETVNELAEALGWDLEKVLNLEAPTKIDGKEGKARLRDLIKGYQLEGHLNQKLMTFADEKKAFEAEANRKVSEIRDRMQQVDQAAQLAQRILDGEFAEMNWQELQRTDPLKFQSEYGAYKMRLDGIQGLSRVLQEEQQRSSQKAEADYKSYLTEQSRLLDSKVPEWADLSVREKQIAEMTSILSETYGITDAELKSVADHRQLLIARDAVAWQKLQKSKPAVVNKVKAAPKLIKPGAQQSRAAQDNFIAQKERERLRSTGKVADAKAPLKRLLFNS